MRLPTRREVGRLLGVLLLVGIVAPFVVQAVPAVVGADHSYVVLSGSMEPEISPGDAVVVKDVSPSDIRVGDVITFHRDGTDTPTTHRVVDVRRTDGHLVYKTKGDANEEPDPGWTPASAVTGRVYFVIPYLGRVVLFGNTPAGFLLLAGVPLGLLVGSELWAVARSGFAGRDDPDERSAEESGTSETTDGSAETDAARTADEPADSTDDALTLTRADLRLSTAVLVAFAAYSIWVATRRPDGVSIAVAAAVGGSALLALAVYYASGGERTLRALTVDDTTHDRRTDDAE